MTRILSPHAAAIALACASLLTLAGCSGDVSAPELPYPQRFESVTAGYEHTCATTTSQRTFCWGNPALSRLGIGDAVPQCESNRCPAPLPVRESLPFEQLSAGWLHSCGLVDQRAFCWGYNRSGQLGDMNAVLSHCWDDPPFFCSVDPSPVTIGSPLQKISSGRLHACALTFAGRVLCWGYNIAGQLGRGFKNEVPRPDPQSISELVFTDLSAGFGHTCGVTDAGGAVCWGFNEFGLLGTGDTEERLRPTAVAEGFTFRRIETGGHFTCGITIDSDVYCWGWGWEGRLGTGNMDDHYTPAEVLMPEAAAALDAGQHHTCAIGQSGALYCWGVNYSGQLGVGDFDRRVAPTIVPLDEPVVQVSAGFLHTCAITADERLYCWGDNTFGQLGAVDVLGSSLPRLVNP